MICIHTYNRLYDSVQLLVCIYTIEKENENDKYYNHIL